MIADLKPYAEYKESGLPWLGPGAGALGVRGGCKSAVMHVIETGAYDLGPDEVLASRWSTLRVGLASARRPVGFEPLVQDK
jgi:hypothetical protein